jgi:hypothetical protein
MLGEGCDPKSIEEAARVLDALRQRLEHPSPYRADGDK